MESYDFPVCRMLDDVLEVEVMLQDIYEGVPGMGDQCPIARAIQRAYPGMNVYVDNDDILIVGMGNGHCMQESSYCAPYAAERFIALFDQVDTRDAAVPFKFKASRRESDCDYD